MPSIAPKRGQATEVAPTKARTKKLDECHALAGDDACQKRPRRSANPQDYSQTNVERNHSRPSRCEVGSRADSGGAINIAVNRQADKVHNQNMKKPME